MPKGFKNRILIEADIDEPWLEVDDAGLIPHAYDLIKKVAKFKLNHRLPASYKKMPATMRDREFFTEFVIDIIPKSFPKLMWGDPSSIYYSPEFWTIWLKNQDFITNINGELYFYHVVHVGRRNSKNLYFLQTPYEKKVIDAVLNKYNTKGDIDVYVRAEYANETDFINTFLTNIDKKVIEMTDSSDIPEDAIDVADDDSVEDIALESTIIKCHHKMIEEKLTESRATSIDFVKETLNPLVNDIADKVNDLRLNGDLTQYEFSILTGLLSDISSASAKAIEKLDEIRESTVVSSAKKITEAKVSGDTLMILRRVDDAAAKANQKFDDALDNITLLNDIPDNKEIKHRLSGEFYQMRANFVKWAERFLSQNLIAENISALHEDSEVDDEDEINLDATENEPEAAAEETSTGVADDITVEIDPEDIVDDEFIEVSTDQVSLRDISDVEDLDIFTDVLVSDKDDMVTFVVTIPDLSALKDYLDQADVDEISVSDEIPYDGLSESTKKKFQQYKKKLQ